MRMREGGGYARQGGLGGVGERESQEGGKKKATEGKGGFFCSVFFGEGMGRMGGKGGL